MNSPTDDKSGPTTAKAKALPKPIAASLKQFFANSETTPERFVIEMLRRPPASITSEERDLLVRDLTASLPKRIRLINAVAELSSPASILAEELASLAEDVVRTMAPADVSMPAIRMGVDPEAIRKAATALVSRGPSEKRPERERLALLWLAACWIKGGLAGHELAEMLLLLRGKVSAASDLDAELAAILVHSLNRSRSLGDVLSLYLLQRDKIASALAGEKQARATHQKVSTELAEAQQKLVELERQIRDAADTLQKRNTDYEKIKKDLEDHEAVARQSRRALTARINGLLQGQISPLVRDAQDAALEPVRPHIIKDRLESLETLIKKEAKWLESSD